MLPKHETGWRHREGSCPIPRREGMILFQVEALGSHMYMYGIGICSLNFQTINSFVKEQCIENSSGMSTVSTQQSYKAYKRNRSQFQDVWNWR